MDIYASLKNTVKGKKVAVLGLGVSNLPLIGLLLDTCETAALTVYDKKSLRELGEDALALEQRGVGFVCGENCFERIEADVIFRSPGIRPDKEGIVAAIEGGAMLTSEIEEFMRVAPARLFAVTGSDGKTTTTTLTGKFLEAAGRVFVGGNIGTPLLDKAGEMSESDSAVLELSSFQLMRVSRAPTCAAITNISPNHMDWHTDEEEYAGAKFNVVGDGTERVVLNADSPRTYAFARRLIEQGGREIILFSSTKAPRDIPEGADLIWLEDRVITLTQGGRSIPLLDSRDILLPGKHNVENYMTAIGLTYGYVPKEIYTEVARSFGGVEHRLELVRVKDGVSYYNSSIDSSPTRTAAALSALEGRDIVAICGGYDKRIPFAPLAQSLCERARAVVLTGATAGKIREAILNCPDYDPQRLLVAESESFEEAVEKAADLGREGGCVVLSPACASFDRFKNFAQRGRYFKELVMKL